MFTWKSAFIILCNLRKYCIFNSCQSMFFFSLVIEFSWFLGFIKSLIYKLESIENFLFLLTTHVDVTYIIKAFNGFMFLYWMLISSPHSDLYWVTLVSASSHDNKYNYIFSLKFITFLFYVNVMSFPDCVKITC